MKPYASVAAAIAAAPTGATVRVGRVDGWTHSMLSRRFRVTSFPTFFILQGGQVYEHRGKRSAEGLLHFALPPPFRAASTGGGGQLRGGGRGGGSGGGGSVSVSSSGSDVSDGVDGEGGGGAAAVAVAAAPANPVAVRGDVVVDGVRVDRAFGPMAPHWRVATYASAVGGDVARAGRRLSAVQLGGVVAGGGVALALVILVGLAVLTTPGVLKID